MNGLSPWHLVILVLVVVVLFGAKRLPDAARSIGKSMKIFRAETKDLGDKKDKGEQADESDSSASAEPKQLPEANSPDKAGSSEQDGKDEQIKNLQKQLDDLKQSENAQK
ncbi:MAG: twin-arginine translocase TatA/TatE family subunit [Pseudonocardiaceae bacterium]|nr:twin-arginine translocase TatA/TatE family subunit [Pseudonocardiaceae bacterium]